LSGAASSASLIQSAAVEPGVGVEVAGSGLPGGPPDIALSALAVVPKP